MMRSKVIGLVFTLLLVLTSSAAFARASGHMAGHMGGGHWGGHVAHPGIHRFAAFRGARFHHHRRFFVGYAAFGYDGCWQWRPTYWGWRRVWVCGYPYYGYF